MLALDTAMLDNPQDADKFERIYLCYRDRMMRIAMKILKNNHHDAEDAVHDAFVRLTAHVGELEDADSVRTQRYVYTMAKNAAIDIYRKRYGDKAPLSLEELFDYPSDTDIPQEYADHEMYHDFLNILQTMPIYYREVLSLYWLEGLKPARIAVILNRSVQTVNKQLRRGNRLLRKIQEKGGQSR